MGESGSSTSSRSLLLVNELGGRFFRASLRARSISAPSLFWAGPLCPGPREDLGRRCVGVGIPVDGVTLPGVASVGKRDILGLSGVTNAEGGKGLFRREGGVS